MGESLLVFKVLLSVRLRTTVIFLSMDLKYTPKLLRELRRLNWCNGVSVDFVIAKVVVR